MKFWTLLYDLLRHLGDDTKWRDMIGYIGTTNLYIVLFAIVFAETGLVVTPFLPGDSLLFALGAIGSGDTGINLPLVTGLLIVAAVLGDAVNYAIGYRLGPAVFSRSDDPNRPKRFTDKLLNRKHLLKAQEFYEKYGGKTIILARFVPVVRTFAPFVAGVGKMNYFKFFAYNVVGGIAWVLVCVGAGVAFGNIPFVKKNFELVIVGIVVVSVLPMVIEFVRARRAAKQQGFPAVAETPAANGDA
ncbi:MAG TPA: VTT domain-containing protein [Humisphaera sp.]